MDREGTEDDLEAVRDRVTGDEKRSLNYYEVDNNYDLNGH